MSRARVAVVVSGFPRRTETFALNELLALERQGLIVTVFATKPGDGHSPQPGNECVRDRLQYVPPLAPADQAEWVVARLRGEGVTGVHGYFAHRPAEVASLVADRLRLPYGFSAHARDARKVPSAVLADRARRARCVMACNPDVAAEFPRDALVQLVPHGVDLARFHVEPAPQTGRLSLLAVGRLVAKKGFDTLIEAVSRLSRSWHLRIVGEGPERARLQQLIIQYGLARKVLLCGGKTHEELPGEFARAHVVVVPSVPDSTGDRDGLPNVVLETMASGRPIIASDAGAIATAITNGQTGILVPPGDPTALGDAIEDLAGSSALRDRLGRTARVVVERDYDLERCTQAFCHRVELAYA